MHPAEEARRLREAPFVRRIASVLVAFFFLCGCASSDGDSRPSQPHGGRAGFATAELIVEGSARTQRLQVLVASTAAERRQGLMERRRLAPYDGMLFEFPKPVRTPFWMKNTLIPLSIAFLSEDGRILRIIDMTPCRKAPCRIYYPGVRYQSALEVLRGDFDRRGIRVGDRVELFRKD
ncbi:MAG TPA: DUF192 domain-containing protein [Actinomycetota bacterium]|nr:DUF192 domain-containing protein [Actinomycetota bacterium]